MRQEHDAIVIGSAVGECCIAALLAHGGRRVLLAEKRAHLDGRFSTVNRNGYLCATGGLAVPVGRNLEEVCQAVGIPGDSGQLRSDPCRLSSTVENSIDQRSIFRIFVVDRKREP